MRAGLGDIALCRGMFETMISATDIRSERNAARKKPSTEEAQWRHYWTTYPQQIGSLPSRMMVLNLFFAYQTRVELLQANPEVLPMDCIYLTYKYRLPLLRILSYINLQMFFFAGLCFLGKKKRGLRLDNCELPPQYTTTCIHQRSGRVIDISVTVLIPTSAPGTDRVTTGISVPIFAHAPILWQRQGSRGTLRSE